MRKFYSYLIFPLLLFLSLPVIAQRQSTIFDSRASIGRRRYAQSEKLFSSSVGQRFYEMAYELANSKDIGPNEAEQAIVFLQAATDLGGDTNKIQPLLLKLACRYSEKDRAELVYYTLEGYVNESADLDVVIDAIGYLLEQLNTREEREVLLKGMLRSLGRKNTVIRSELSTLLGLLMTEKSDFKSAQYYLIQAYSDNQHNHIAFEKLAELMPEQIGPAIYLGNLKLHLREDPSNIDTAITFAQFAEQLQLYDIAAKGYEYCAHVFRYLYPSEPLPSNIYIPWMVNYYNSKRNKHRCLQIASALRKGGQFDLVVESIAGKAAMKIGNTEEATKIFQSAEEKAQQLLEQGTEAEESMLTSDNTSTDGFGSKQFAWYYCFVQPDAYKALDWSNRAYAREPNLPMTAALLAYSLVMNDQIEWVTPLLNNYKRTQIADFALAQIQLKQGQRESAVKILKSAIAKDPGSLVAEAIKALLAEQGVKYAPSIDPNEILIVLENSFSNAIVPEFIAPENIISVQLNIPGNEFFFGSKIEGTVAITNNSSEPLVISDEGLLKGGVRIDADVRGDIRKSIPNLISTRIHNTLLVEPGHSAFTSVQLTTGELGKILHVHPQASMDIEFTLYLDPVRASDGTITNRLTNIKPVKVLVKRPGIELTSEYLRNRFDSVTKGQTGQKIKTAYLFTGLLMEQQEMSGGKILYRCLYADWMPTMLRSTLIHQSGLLRNVSDEDWVVKVHTMADMLYFPLDRELTNAISENLNNSKWPVRIMTLYLLAKSPGSQFDQVLDWAAKYDSNEHVRNLVNALIAAKAKGPKPAESELPDEPEMQLPTWQQ